MSARYPREMRELLRVLGDQSAGAQARTKAAAGLAHHPEAPVLAPLCSVAEDGDDDGDVLAAVGRAVARIVMATGGFDDTFFLANWADSAFLAFDAELAVIAAEHNSG